MQIGNLSRTRHPDEQHDNAAFQALRILLVAGLMAGGSLALWLSGGTSAPAGGMVTAVPPQLLAGEPQLVELPYRDERMQVADADPSILMKASGPPAEAPYLPASGPQDPLPASTTTEPFPAAGRQASAAPEPTLSASSVDIDMTGAVAKQASLAGPSGLQSPAADLVDLNRAPIEQLNSLKGAGALGRAIIKGRPYKSVDDLMRKKVLRRPVFEKIKDQVTVQ
jgi:hypothetical protein